MILLLGNGLLGSEIARSLELNKLRFKQLTHKDVDLTCSYKELKRIFKPWLGEIAHVINTTGFTKVDLSECNKEEALKLNAYSVNTLANICNYYSSTLVQISTDFIFDGSHDVNHPYIEEDQPNPVNFYGYSKLLGEQMIRDSGCKHLIIRTGKLYNQSKGFIFSILKKMKEEKYICGIKNQVFTPTNAFNLANQIVELYKHYITGTYHVTNQGYTSAYDLINYMKKQLNSNIRVDESFLYDQFSQARRPAMTVLSMKKLESLGLLNMPNWKDSLEYTLNQLQD